MIGWTRRSGTARTAAAGASLALEVSDVAFHVGVAPHTHHGVDAFRIHDAGEGLEVGSRRERDAAQNRVVLEAAGSEHADAAAAEQVIRQERSLRQRAAVLILAEVEVLEAAERAGLQVAPAVDQTDIELALLPAGIIHVLALGLHRVRAVSAEWARRTGRVR